MDAIVLIGGLGSLPGAVVGALLFYGSGLIVVLLTMRWRGLTLFGLVALLGALMQMPASQ